MPELEITIKTKAELAGAEAALANIEKQIGKAKALGKEYEKLEGKAKAAQALIGQYKDELARSGVTSSGAVGTAAGALAGPDPQKLSAWSQRAREDITGVRKATERAGEAHVAAGKSADKHAASLAGLEKIVNALNGVLPGLGWIAQAPISSVGAAVAAAAGALAIFQSYLERVNAELDEMAAENAAPLTNRMKALREAIVNSGKSLAEFQLQLAEAARSEQTLTDKTEQQIAAIRRQTEQAKKLADATKENSLATLELLHTQGLISEEQHAAKKLQIEREYVRKKGDIDDEGLRKEMESKVKAANEAEAKQAELDTKASNAILSRTKVQEDVAALPSDEDVKARLDRASQYLLKTESGMNPELLQMMENIGPQDKNSFIAAWRKAHPRRDVPPTGPGFLPSMATGIVDWQTSYDEAVKAYDEWAPKKKATTNLQAELASLPERRKNLKVDEVKAVAEDERAKKAALENKRFVTQTRESVSNTVSRVEDAVGAPSQIERVTQSTESIRRVQSSPELATRIAMGIQSGQIRSEADLLNVLNAIDARQKVLQGALSRFLARFNSTSRQVQQQADWMRNGPRGQ